MFNKKKKVEDTQRSLLMAAGSFCRFKKKNGSVI